MPISKRTRFKFGDVASSHGTIRTIHEVFDAEDFAPKEDYEGHESGDRRWLVASYHAAIDFDDPDQGVRLVRVYLDAIDSWGTDFAGDLYPSVLDLIKSMRRDGVPVGDGGELTAPLPTKAKPSMRLDRFDRLGEPLVVEEHLRRIAENVSNDPAAAVGSAKELVESVCKFILDDYSVAYAQTDDLLALYKKVAAELRLSRESVPDSAKGSAAAQRILQNLSTAVQSLAELRNELGVGHGRTKLSPAFARHARLAANAARTLVEFLLETWHERRPAESG